jgi:UDP-glucose 4-epimerase|tara:strand:- start:13820 stop:14821 length:1002 start_codon:yes stop_codon:yes gene_type:complete
MKIFITGVAGFLGSHLADKLLDLGHAVHGNDNFLGGFRRNINHRVVFTETNCLSTDELALYMEGCDVVVHCAATAHEGLSVFSPQFITNNIYGASVSTMSAAIQAKVKRFVFCSSMARYGEGVAPFVETHATAPVDPYGIAKVAAEETLKVLCKVHGMEYNIAIPHNIVGPRQRFDDPFRNVLSIMANRNLRGLPSYVYGDGSQQRCFSYIDDCISCLEKMVIDPTIINETINIGPDENPITINEAAKLVAEECYYDGDSVRYPGRPQEVKFATCSSDKARSLLGYETTTSIEDAIKYTVEYIRQVNPRPFDYGFPLEIQNDKTPEVWKDRLL